MNSLISLRRNGGRRDFWALGSSKASQSKLTLSVFTLFIVAYPMICLAEDLNHEALFASNVDYAIFSDSERRFIFSQIPLYKTSIERPSEVLPRNELELTLREIELRKFESETDDEFIERGNNLYTELVEHPELFQQRARSVSASRSRFRSGLLTPLTINQLDIEIAQEVENLETFQLSKPIKIKNSIFILRKESSRSSTKLDR